jgi:hypothetical protein
MAIYRGDGGAGVANPTYETAVIADQAGNSGKYLTTNGSATSWATVTTGATNLDGLTDVTLTSPSSGQVLKYNGTIWVNDTDSTGSGSFSYPGAGIPISTGSAWGTSITNNSTNWDSAYTDRLKWDGGSTGLTAATGRTSLGVTATGADTTYAYRANNLSDLASASTARTNLGATTLGSNLFTITNPSAITFPRYNVDNTVSALDASTYRTAIGLGTAATMTGPSGAIVGTTDTQTLSAKTLTGTKETVYTITDGAAFEIDPANGGLQIIVLGASRTPKGTNFTAGQSVTLHIDDGTAYTITWTDTTFGTSGVTWVGGSAPTLATSGYTIVELWKVGSKVYGAYVGTVA